MTHFARRLAEIIGSTKRLSRYEIAKQEAQRAQEQTRPGREKRRARMLMRSGAR